MKLILLKCVQESIRPREAVWLFE